MRRVMSGRLSPQLLEYEGLENRSQQRPVGGEIGGGCAEQGAGESRVAEVQLGRLHQPVRTVAVPGRQSFQKKDPIQQRHVVADRRPAQAEGRREVGEVEELGGPCGSERQQPGQRVQRMDARQVPDVALNESVRVVAMPIRPPSSRGTRQRRGIAAGGDAVGEVPAQPLGGPGPELAGEEPVEKAGRFAGQLRLRQRMQPQHLHASGQGIGELGYREHMRGSGEQEAAGEAAAIHLPFDRREERRRPLHLVQNDALGQFGDEAGGVGGRCVARHVVVEADVGVASPIPHHAGEGGLAALARPVDQHHG